MKRLTIALCLISTPVFAEDFEVAFINHISAGLPELDVYLDTGVADMVTQIQPDRVTEEDLEQPLFAAAQPVPHNPFDEEASGPYPKGRALGLSLEKWLSATGSAHVTCDGDVGRVRADFANLVPEATYTLWYAMVPMPPTKPFTGALDLPLGARDGSDATFATSANGTAKIDVSFSPCLEPDKRAGSEYAGSRVALRRSDSRESPRRFWSEQPRADLRAVSKKFRTSTNHRRE